MRLHTHAKKLRLWAALLCFGLALFVLRHHIYILSQVVYTYSVFYQRDLDVYEYPRAAPLDAANASDKKPILVPKIIHQIWLKEEGLSSEPGSNVATEPPSTLSKYEAARSSCNELHPSWTHKLWTDANATEFVRTNYPAIYPHYEGYRQIVSRTNILRYLLLHHFGGVYLDLDIACREPLDDLLTLPWLTPAAHPAGINNAFILVKPNHPFLSRVIENIPLYDRHWPMPYVENMFSTGCMFISIQYVQPRPKNREELFILGLDGKLEPHMLRGHSITPLFEHAGASSWHRWDAAAIIMIGRHAIGFSLALISAVVLLVFALGKAFANGRRRDGLRFTMTKTESYGDEV